MSNVRLNPSLQSLKSTAIHSFLESFLSCQRVFMPHKLIVGLMLSGVMSSAYSANLPDIIRYAVTTYPTIIESQIAVETDQLQVQQSKMAHLPVVGLQASQYVSGVDAGQRSTGINGRLNLYSGGAMAQQTKTYGYTQEYHSYIIDQTGEELANTIAGLYIQGLNNFDQLKVNQKNWDRHEKIIGDLKIIVQYDRGRRSDLTQAQARQLQVTTRMVQLKNDILSIESKLHRYMQPSDRINWEDLQGLDFESRTDYSQHPSLLAQYADSKRAESQAKFEMKNRRPKLDLDMSTSRGRAANLVINWNFFDPANFGKQDIAKNEVRLAQAKIEDVRRSIAERVQTATRDAEQSLQTIKATQAQVSSAEQVAEAFELQFTIARRSILDVLNSYSELSAVESAVVNAKAQRRQSLLAMKYASGQLVDWAMRIPPATRYSP